MTVTSHDRVIAALNHKQADERIPMDFSCVLEVTENLKAHLGVKTFDELLEGFEIDIRTVEPRYVGTDERTVKDDGTVLDMFGIEHDDLIRDGKLFKHFKGPFGCGYDSFRYTKSSLARSKQSGPFEYIIPL